LLIKGIRGRQAHPLGGTSTEMGRGGPLGHLLALGVELT
jgi:hypothetical protein